MRESREKKIKLLISAGGTGGHLFPAIAVANDLKSRYKDKIDILFVGSKNNLEATAVPKQGYDIKYINIRGFNRGNILKNISLIFRIFISLIKSFFIIRGFRPNVVLGMGSYVSGPVLFVAYILRIKTIIHEQNAQAGLTNKILSRYVDKICVAYDNMEKFFPSKKIIKTGNPVRKEIINLNSYDNTDQAYKYFNFSPSKKTVFFLAGSLGAKSFNDFISNNLNFFKTNDIQLIWQCGKSYRKGLNIALDEDLKKIVYLTDFIENIDYAYKVSNIIVSRAGAGAISELLFVAKPTIFIPSPNVVANHQLTNAIAIENKKAAIVITEDNMERELSSSILKLIGDKELRNNLSRRMKDSIIFDSTYKIISQIIDFK